jgi:UDP-N-acetylmuramyl pentapeptide phosphotransferase/UDP-N-acetylglucosamine-1-phosphate transferase
MVTILSLMMFNSRIGFIDDQFLHFSLAGVLVFNFYNFRKRAKCFAGDVGSVSMALIVMFAIGLLIYSTNNLMFILLLAVYGVDSVLTIIHRLAKKENIFEAHRSHLYQWMVKPGPFSHLQMAVIYGMLQLLINTIVFVSIDYPASKQLFISACILILMAILYISIKLRYKKKYNLV